MLQRFRIVLALSVCLLPAIASAQSAREVRAVRVKEPLKIDGRLDEEIYAAVEPAGNFVQQLPREGLAATEPTATSGSFSTTTTCTCRCAAPTATPSGWSPTSCGAITATSSR